MPIRISGSTGISGLDGSATTPVLQGASANSGIYYSGNTVFVSTSGTNAMTIGPTGNVALTNNNFSIAGQYISPYSGMMKNRIINGDMRIDQRFSGAANNNQSGTGNYVIDRWMHTVGSGANKLRFQQNNTNGPGSSATQIATGFSNYFGANVVSSNTVNNNDYWLLCHFIEGLNTQDLNWGTSSASSATLSFWVYSSVPGNHGGSLRSGNNARSYPFQYTINAANTWQYQTVTIPGDTTTSTGTWYSNNSIGIGLFFSLGTGSTYSPTANGTWQNGNYLNSSGSVNIVSNANGSFYLTGVQLEKGSQATPFEFRHYTTELQLCQRYFEVLPVNTGDADPNYIGQIVVSTLGDMGAKFTVTKRTSSPTVTLNSVTQVRQGSNNITPSGGFSITYTTSGTASIRATHSGWTPGQTITLIGGSGSPSITVSAELAIQN
jgi:hypothetical protein